MPGSVEFMDVLEHHNVNYKEAKGGILAADLPLELVDVAVPSLAYEHTVGRTPSYHPATLGYVPALAETVKVELLSEGPETAAHDQSLPSDIASSHSHDHPFLVISGFDSVRMAEHSAADTITALIRPTTAQELFHDRMFDPQNVNDKRITWAARVSWLYDFWQAGAKDHYGISALDAAEIAYGTPNEFVKDTLSKTQMAEVAGWMSQTLEALHIPSSIVMQMLRMRRAVGGQVLSSVSVNQERYGGPKLGIFMAEKLFNKFAYDYELQETIANAALSLGVVLKSSINDLMGIVNFFVSRGIRPTVPMLIDVHQGSTDATDMKALLRKYGLTGSVPNFAADSDDNGGLPIRRNVVKVVALTPAQVKIKEMKEKRRGLSAETAGRNTSSVTGLEGSDKELSTSNKRPELSEVEHIITMLNQGLSVTSMSDEAARAIVALYNAGKFNSTVFPDSYDEAAAEARRIAGVRADNRGVIRQNPEPERYQ